MTEENYYRSRHLNARNGAIYGIGFGILASALATIAPETRQLIQENPLEVLVHTLQMSVAGLIAISAIGHINQTIIQPIFERGQKIDNYFTENYE
tara:strand:+ start:324 stop:608 length:285 start_codon:yes stop_codon:yes gene_type:complete